MAINMAITEGLFQETIKLNHIWLLQIPKLVKSKQLFVFGLCCAWLRSLPRENKQP